jgi:hypothetical protein
MYMGAYMALAIRYYRLTVPYTLTENIPLKSKPIHDIWDVFDQAIADVRTSHVHMQDLQNTSRRRAVGCRRRVPRTIVAVF